MRIAIVGGTFDPIHNGHLAAAESVASTFQVDEVHFVPAFSPPHKQSRGMTSPFHRFAMVALATMAFDRFRTSTVEVDALEKRYTVETLERMRQIYPTAEMLFVVGTDMYKEIETWRDFRRLFELAHLVIVNRPGYPFREDLAPFRVLSPNEPVDLSSKDAVFYLPFVEQPISSTEIRDVRKRGEDVRQFLPTSVWSYIEKTTSTAPIKSEKVKSEIEEAVDAALDKKALDIVVLDIKEVCSFTDTFIVCTGTSSRHNQTIADGIEDALRQKGLRTIHIEGRAEGEWILMDYFDFVVHIFSAQAREFYDLERLWRAGKRLDLQESTGRTK